MNDGTTDDPISKNDIALTTEKIAQKYDLMIVIMRWAATWIDMFIIAFILVFPWLFGETVSLYCLPFGLINLVLYFPVFESWKGFTPGKWLIGLRVVDENGNRPSFGAACKRTLARLVEVNPFLIGGIIAAVIVLVSKSRQRLGDMWANTFVLKKKDLQSFMALQKVDGCI